jgi:hypothetical protein
LSSHGGFEFADGDISFDDEPTSWIPHEQ